MRADLSQRVLAALSAASDGRAGVQIGMATLAGLLPDLNKKSLMNGVQHLRGRGFLQIESPGVWLLTEAGRDWLASGRQIAGGQGRRHTLRTNGLRERAWWLMREVRHFTLLDLLTTLARGDERDAANNLHRYIRVLERAGVLVKSRRLVRSPGGFNTVMWRLVRDLGRKAPVHRQRHGLVFDPNSGEILRLDIAQRASAESPSKEAHHEHA